MVTIQIGAGGGESADGVVDGVGDVEIARGVHGEGLRGVEPRELVGAVRGAENARRPRKRGDSARAGDLADRVIVGVGNVEISGGINAHSGGMMKTRAGARAIGETVGDWRAGEGGHCAARCEQADGVVAAIRHIEISEIVQGDTRGI